MRKDFLGRGWGFPFHFDAAAGGIGLSEYEENIRQCVTLILGTKPGERQMLPEFGCNIHELMFAPANAATASLISHVVHQSLARWEPRIEVLKVTAWPDGAGAIRVQVNYKIIATGAETDLGVDLNAGG